MKLSSPALECDECSAISLIATYDPITHSVTYKCVTCSHEFYDTNLDFDREDVNV